MKTIINMFLLAIAMSLAQMSLAADPDKTVPCIEIKKLFGILNKDYNEIPVWYGTNSRDASKYVLFANAKRGTWTFVQFDADVGCVLGAGSNSKIVDNSIQL